LQNLSNSVKQCPTLAFNHNRKAHRVILDLGPGGGFFKGALLMINLHVVGSIVLHQSNHMKNMVKLVNMIRGCSQGKEKSLLGYH
jgi:hypothetical protein